MQRSQVGQNAANGKVKRQTGEQMDAGVQANHALATQKTAVHDGEFEGERRRCVARGGYPHDGECRGYRMARLGGERGACFCDTGRLYAAAAVAA
jgi:hypothetical protein